MNAKMFDSEFFCDTDTIDAKILADYGEKCFERLRIYKPYNSSIKKLVMRLSDLKDMAQKEENRLKAPDNAPIVIKSIQTLLKTYEKEITKPEDHIEQLILKDAENTCLFVRGNNFCNCFAGNGGA